MSDSIKVIGINSTTGVQEQSASTLSAFAKTADLGTAAAANTGTSSGNVPVLDGAGKLATSVLPALALVSANAVASQAAMLALTAEPGDLAIRSDISKTFILSASPASTLANWLELKTPTDVVTSVNTRTGAVTGLLDASNNLNDVGSAATARANLLPTGTDGQVLTRVSGVWASADAAGGSSDSLSSADGTDGNVEDPPTDGAPITATAGDGGSGTGAFPSGDGGDIVLTPGAAGGDLGAGVGAAGKVIVEGDLQVDGAISGSVAVGDLTGGSDGDFLIRIDGVWTPTGVNYAQSIGSGTATILNGDSGVFVSCATINTTDVPVVCWVGSAGSGANVALYVSGITDGVGFFIGMSGDAPTGDDSDVNWKIVR